MASICLGLNELIRRNNKCTCCIKDHLAYSRVVRTTLRISLFHIIHKKCEWNAIGLNGVMAWLMRVIQSSVTKEGPLLLNITNRTNIVTSVRHWFRKIITLPLVVVRCIFWVSLGKFVLFLDSRTRIRPSQHERMRSLIRFLSFSLMGIVSLNQLCNWHRHSLLI